LRPHRSYDFAMNTIVINVEDAGKDLEGVLYRLRSRGARALLMSHDVVVAELSPFPKPEENEESEAQPATPEGWQRVVRSPITGRSVVAARPGERMITSEEIYELIRGP
jgi:hypothetical protein